MNVGLKSAGAALVTDAAATVMEVKVGAAKIICWNILFVACGVTKLDVMDRREGCLLVKDMMVYGLIMVNVPPCNLRLPKAVSGTNVEVAGSKVI
mmetsp:Transcript_24650/g.23644  ORF Transcript_24650/g.23644 Transcript_24650/m.23644 type:complete len:95 (+) Transcript_24650:283-567(+)